VAIARRSGAEAVHPGYGFLSENPEFSKACKDAGLIFIGPSPEAMRKCGSKLEARRLMAEAGVPVAVGSPALRDAEHAADEAAKIGYPALLKVSAGGGGIGMQIVEHETDMPRLFTMATSSAQQAFGDTTLFLEKYLGRPRHIEIQYLADHHGHAIHLGERECSIQRRHQKLVEESPSPAITPERRAELGELTVRGMKAMGYANAGTAEFLFADGKFHFNEINARLQVEHPVTEAVTGLDLVKHQILIAAGEELEVSQDEVEWRGHAIECRINAEDPLNDFLPSPGTISEFHAPGGPGIRVDAGVLSGSRVPEHYDSLVAKVIAHGHTRHAAISRMRAALRELRVEGLATNREFHLAVIESEGFARGDLSTRFIAENGIEERLLAGAHAEREVVAAMAGILATDHEVAGRFRRRLAYRPRPTSAWASSLRPRGGT
jgi:pyruvate carboxylase subunit A